MSDAPTPEQSEGDPRSVVLLAVLFEGGLIGLAWLLGWAFDRLPLSTFRWNWSDAALGALTTLPMLALFFVLVRWPVGPLARMKKLTDEFIRPLLSPCTVLDLFGISILAGLGEEMLFRGVLQGAMSDWLQSPVQGLIIASVLFGLGHALTWTYAIFATLMGLYLGWIWQWTGNLMTVALAHALYDFIALLILVRLMPTSQRLNN